MAVSWPTVGIAVGVSSNGSLGKAYAVEDWLHPIPCVVTSLVFCEGDVFLHMSVFTKVFTKFAAREARAPGWDLTPPLLDIPSRRHPYSLLFFQGENLRDDVPLKL